MDGVTRMRNEMSTAKTGVIRGQAGWLWAVWLVMLGVWTLALLTPYPVQVKDQVLPADNVFPTGKVLHVVAYAFLTGFASFLPLRGGWRWLPVLVLSLHGFGTEFCQLFVPLRTGSLHDVGLDHGGILLGLLLTLRCWLARR
jgi:VanZ family protein